MRKFKAYTLMEVMVVMIIMIILLGLSFSSYTSFTEATKFNEDVSVLQHDILIIQRASMLMQRNEDEDWIYGLVIDFGGIKNNHDGTYDFYKWCSPSPDFTAEEKNSEYPAQGGPIPSIYTSISECTEGTNRLVKLIGYGYGSLNLGDDIHIDSNVKFLVFESVSGRAFLYGEDNQRIEDPNIDLEIVFDKNYGQSKILTVKNLTGRTKLNDVL